LRAGVGSVTARVRRAWAMAGTRLGFWVHFTGMSSATAFGVLWGNTYLVRAAGFSAAGAGTVLMVDVIALVIAAPIIGWLIGRWPAARVSLVLVISLVTLAGWLVAVTAFGNHPPTAYVVALFVVMTLGRPASTVAFALARDYNSNRTLGTASGVVNVGGFPATVVIAIAVGIGWALDARGGTSAHTLRSAVLVAVAVQAGEHCACLYGFDAPAPSRSPGKHSANRCQSRWCDGAGTYPPVPPVDPLRAIHSRPAWQASGR
jgi:hypothetical protein